VSRGDGRAEKDGGSAASRREREQLKSAQRERKYDELVIIDMHTRYWTFYILTCICRPPAPPRPPPPPSLALHRGLQYSPVKAKMIPGRADSGSQHPHASHTGASSHIPHIPTYPAHLHAPRTSPSPLAPPSTKDTAKNLKAQALRIVTPFSSRYLSALNVRHFFAATTVSCRLLLLNSPFSGKRTYRINGSLYPGVGSPDSRNAWTTAVNVDPRVQLM
jgi:hypothetical protein